MIKIKMNWVIYTVSNPQTVTLITSNNNSSLHLLNSSLHLLNSSLHLLNRDSHLLNRDSHLLHINTRNNKASKSLY